MLMSTEGKCQQCVLYRNTLRVMIHRRQNCTASLSPSAPSSRTNMRYLSTPQRRRRYKSLRYRCDAAERKVKQLSANIKRLVASQSVQVDKELHSDLASVMEANNSHIHDQFAENSFQRLFWDQQFQMSKCKTSRQYRWHPMMVKWCLHLKLISSAAYHAMRSSGFVTLPSERTLRDYTHVIKADTGIKLH